MPLNALKSARMATLASLAALCLAILFAGPVQAAAEYDDSKLDAFVEAAMKVEVIKAAWFAQAQSTTDEQELNALNEEAKTALLQAVEGTPNMSVDDYNAIVDASNADEGLRDRIKTKIDQKVAQLEKEQQQRPDQPPQQGPEPAPDGPAPDGQTPEAVPEQQPTPQ